MCWTSPPCWHETELLPVHWLGERDGDWVRLRGPFRAVAATAAGVIRRNRCERDAAFPRARSRTEPHERVPLAVENVLHLELTYAFVDVKHDVSRRGHFDHYERPRDGRVPGSVIAAWYASPAPLQMDAVVTTVTFEAATAGRWYPVRVATVAESVLVTRRTT